MRNTRMHHSSGGRAGVPLPAELSMGKKERRPIRPPPVTRLSQYEIVTVSSTCPPLSILHPPPAITCDSLSLHDFLSLSTPSSILFHLSPLDIKGQQNRATLNALNQKVCPIIIDIIDMRKAFKMNGSDYSFLHRILIGRNRKKCIIFLFYKEKRKRYEREKMTLGTRFSTSLEQPITTTARHDTAPHSDFLYTNYKRWKRRRKDFFRVKKM